MTEALLPEPRAAFISDEGPWTPADLNRLAARVSIGVIGLLAAWFQTSEQAALRAQMPWLFAAVAAMAVAGVAMSVWLTSGLRAVRAEHRALHAAARVLLPSTATDVDAEQAWVSADAMTLVHRPQCLFVRGKDVQPVSAVGRAVCPACVL